MERGLGLIQLARRALQRNRRTAWLFLACGGGGQHGSLQPHRHGLPEGGKEPLRKALQSAALDHVSLRAPQAKGRGGEEEVQQRVCGGARRAGTISIRSEKGRNTALKQSLPNRHDGVKTNQHVREGTGPLTKKTNSRKRGAPTSLTPRLASHHLTSPRQYTYMTADRNAGEHKKRLCLSLHTRSPKRLLESPAAPQGKSRQNMPTDAKIETDPSHIRCNSTVPAYHTCFSLAATVPSSAGSSPTHP